LKQKDKKILYFVRNCKPNLCCTGSVMSARPNVSQLLL